MEKEKFYLAQLRHAYHHLKEGRNVSGREVLASVIRDMERSNNA